MYILQASRETEELLMAIVKNDVKLVYKKVSEMIKHFI